MTDWPWLAMLAISGAYLAMFATGELLHHSGRAEAEQTRKLSHVGAGAIALTLPVIFTSPDPVLFVVAAFVIFLFATRQAGLLSSVHGIRRPSSGAFLYPVAIAVTFVLSADAYPRYAIAILALAVGDAAGGIIGGRWGRHEYDAWGQRKTWDGSMAVVATLSVITSVVLALAGTSPAEAIATGLLVGLVAGLVEGGLPYGLDNLGVPIAALAALDAADSAAAAAVLVLAAAGLLGCALAASWVADHQAATRLRRARGATDAR